MEGSSLQWNLVAVRRYALFLQCLFGSASDDFATPVRSCGLLRQVGRAQATMRSSGVGQVEAGGLSYARFFKSLQVQDSRPLTRK